MISQALAISLFVIFVYTCYRDGMIFSNIREWYEMNMPEYIYKPLFDCPICMTPYYGMLFYLFACSMSVTGFEAPFRFWNMALTLLVAGGFSVIFVYLHQIVEALYDESNNKTDTRQTD